MSRLTPTEREACAALDALYAQLPTIACTGRCAMAGYGAPRRDDGGLVKQLSCMHGCVPDRWLTETDLVQIGQATERLGGMMVRTDAEGLTRSPGDSWLGLVPRRSLDAIAADAERTRSLRALHGGRIVAVIDRNQP
jgi:hypothetical protein